MSNWPRLCWTIAKLGIIAGWLLDLTIPNKLDILVTSVFTLKRIICYIKLGKNVTSRSVLTIAIISFYSCSVGANAKKLTKKICVSKILVKSATNKKSSFKREALKNLQVLLNRGKGIKSGSEGAKYYSWLWRKSVSYLA